MNVNYNEELIMRMIQREVIYGLLKRQEDFYPNALMQGTITRYNCTSFLRYLFLLHNPHGLLLVIMNYTDPKKPASFTFLKYDDIQGIKITKQLFVTLITIQCFNGNRFFLRINNRNNRNFLDQQSRLETLIDTLKQKGLTNMKNRHYQKLYRRYLIVSTITYMLIFAIALGIIVFVFPYVSTFMFYLISFLSIIFLMLVANVLIDRFSRERKV